MANQEPTVDYVDRVAAAICEAYGDEWKEKPESGIGLRWGDSGLPARDDFRAMARAAIAVMQAAIDEASAGGARLQQFDD
jgi:hypothetical protein